MRKTTASIIAIAAALGLAACSRDTGDFQSAAEDYIESDNDEFVRAINETLQAGDDPPDENVEFDEATCEEPESTDVGTTYACTATDNTDTLWDFDVEITDDDELTLIRTSRRN